METVESVALILVRRLTSVLKSSVASSIHILRMSNQVGTTTYTPVCIIFPLLYLYIVSMFFSIGSATLKPVMSEQERRELVHLRCVRCSSCGRKKPAKDHHAQTYKYMRESHCVVRLNASLVSLLINITVCLPRVPFDGVGVV